MLTAAENELITRVGPGTPMGALMRRFWMPVHKAATLKAGGAPERVRLLGEDYVIFRAADGRIGFFDEGCPHRRASLALARVEDCALRCIFHGWKIDVSGKVVDVPSEPAERARFGDKVKVRHYPAREAGGLIFVYVGEGEPTQFPELPFTRYPVDHTTILQIPVNCNWLQGVEGQVDSSHVSILHSSSLNTAYPVLTPSLKMTRDYFLADTGPRFEINMTNYGLQAGAIRNVGDGNLFVRVTEYAMPFWTCIPNPGDGDFLMIGQVPVDDTHTTQWYVMHNPHHPMDETGIGHGFQSMLDYDGSSFEKVARKENNWSQDRALLERGHFSGFPNILYEDIAIAESQGPIADRSREYLGQSDAGITRVRRILIDAARDLQSGKTPRGLDGNVDYAEVFGRQTVYRAGEDWREAIRLLRV